MPILESRFAQWTTRERVIAGEDWRPMLDRGLRRAGISDTALGYGHEYSHAHFGQVIACLSGTGSVLVGGEWQSIKPGMAYLSPVNSATAYKAVEQSRWEFAWATYDAQRAQQIFTMPEPVLIGADPELLRLAIEGLYHADLNGFEAETIDTWSETVHQCALAIVSGGKINALAALWNHVDASLDSPWTLTRLCELSNKSDESLRALSLRETGRSPMRQVTHLRMRRASALLRMTDLSLDAIAQQVGYQSAFAFSIAFKRWSGSPPSRNREY